MVHTLTITMLLATAVPLTGPQTRQLAVVRDGSALLDEPGFYVLLENAMSWPGTAGDEAGAMIADYPALHAGPGAYRGRRYLIEGKLLRSVQPARFARAGPWENTWRQWVVQWGSASSDVAVVYMVNPPRARVGVSVRLPARFYKIWRDTDQQGVASDYPVFVGRYAAVSVRGDWAQSVVLAAALAVAALAYFLLRRRVAATRRHDFPLRGPRSNRGSASRRTMQPALPQDQCLSDDPAEALEQLQCYSRIDED